jgi:CRISPR/Cas system-associated exonuclease Cas4 (RecB family)
MTIRDLAKLINSVTKEKTLEEEFLYLLNDTMSRSQKPRQPSKTFKPSSLGGCMRKSYYEVTGEEVDAYKMPDPGLVGINESGTDRHERLQRHIANMASLGHSVEWIDVEAFINEHRPYGTKVVERKGMEVKLYNEVLNLSFMSDGIIKYKGIYYILEIKTEASFKWQTRTAPENKHTYQAASYSVALGLSNVIFMYENRDVCAKKVYIVEITQEDREQKVYGRIETINDHIERNVVPAMTDDRKECKYCSFTSVCAKDGKL